MVILETKRLQLRRFKDEDFSSLYEIFSDPQTMEFYPAPFSVEKTESWIKRNQQRYEEDGYGLWAIWLQETNQLIGDCGLVKQIVEGKEEVEIGYHVHKMYWGNGYATEAAAACKQFGLVSVKTV